MSDNLQQAKNLIKQCLNTKNTYLDLGNCGITDLNDLPELFECKHIETLILSSKWWSYKKRSWIESQNKGEKNQLKTLPNEMPQLQNLKTIILSDIFIKENSGIRFFKRLINSSPYNLGVLEKLNNLNTLYIRHNNISDISFLGKLNSLNTLYIRHNKVSNISFLEKLNNLNVLDLSSNNIADYSFLEKLNNLNTLYLRNNNISDISFLEKLNNLSTLYLKNNNIADISFLEKLTNLTKLDLSSNQISSINEQFFKQFSGYTLNADIGYNGLKIGNNPITSPPMSVLKQDRKAVLAWYAAQKEVLRELKVIFLGEPKAGKTSLLRRLEKNDFKENEPQTDGVFIKALKFEQLPTFSAQKKLHGLVGYFWDFGGQEIMNATHQFFLTERSVYVLLLNAREDKDVGQQIRRWLKRIQATGGQSSVIVAVNQIDVNRGFGFENESELQREFPQIEAFIKISCKEENNQGIAHLKDLLEQHICKTLAHFKTEIDERWLPLKAELQRQTKAKHYLNEGHFIEICQKHQLHESFQQKSAIRFLHDLGFVLHFSHIDLGYYSQNVNLEDYYVLDPSWITAGVYQILTSQYAASFQGEVCTKQLRYIVNDEPEKKASYHIASRPDRLKYTNAECYFLLNILYRFKLCFYQAGRHDFIIPDLLSTKEPPQYEAIRNSANSLQFIYKYAYLPKSVMPHIIVDMHEHLTQKWRTGCIFQHQNCKALLYSYNDEIRIIVVSDKEENKRQKRSVMDIMRFMLGNINAKLAKQPEKEIPLFDEHNVEVERADYEELLERRKDGEQFYKIYKPRKMRFEISRLLEGLSSVREIKRDYRGLEDMNLLLQKIGSQLNTVSIKQATQSRNQIIALGKLHDLEEKL